MASSDNVWFVLSFVLWVVVEERNEGGGAWGFRNFREIGGVSLLRERGDVSGFGAYENFC